MKLFLLDGHSLIFKMYYAFLRRPMVNSKRQDVSILYGFTKYVLELIEKEKPTHFAVAFDPPGKTFRHKLFPEYKGTRQATPELVIEALEPLIGICKALDIPVLMVPGFEGDDVLGSMAVRSAAEGMQVYMVTPDKDFGQLISDKITQYKPGKSGEPAQLVGPKELCEKYGIQNPGQIIDVLTLCGDTADNVPGVNGVGEVGAGKLISKYGSVENIYAHLDELSARQQEMFRQAQDHIDLSHELVTIKTDIPLEITAEDMLLRGEYSPAVLQLFDSYEFPSLKKFLKINPALGLDVDLPTAQTQPGPQPSAPAIEWVEVAPGQLCEIAKQAGRIAITDNGEKLVAAVDDKVCQALPGELCPALGDESIEVFGYNLKQLCKTASVRGRLMDIELMHYLIDPEQSHKPEILCRSYLGIDFASLDCEPQAEEDSQQPEMDLFSMAAAEEPAAQALEKPRFAQAVAISRLGQALEKELKDSSLDKLYYDIEEPLIRVLARMEENGVKVDLGSLAEYADSLRVEMARIEAKVRTMAGAADLNLSSPRQVGKVLFEDLRIDPRMKVRPDGKYPTDEETLQNYADENPIINEILDFRAVKKLLSTYIEPFGQYVSPKDGRIHTTFNQALTATGRLSSSKPNLQNIPIRTERGKMIRKAFVSSSPDSVIVSADYSQIELRLMAHFSADENLLGAFSRGEDVHAMTASRIFNVPLEEVTQDMRRSAKTANFGIMYGISAFGLSQRLRIPRVAAKKLIEDYFASFPTIQSWIEKTKARAASDGYVQTLLGRRRYLPDINSRNATTRSLAERNAVNAPIQGTAADIIKIAMIRVDKALHENGLKSRMILQIHDELVFETPRDEVDTLMNIVKQEMENVLSLDVPLTVECNYGSSWLEAH